MAEIRVDMGKVENSVAFLAFFHSINQDLGAGIRGIEVEPANYWMDIPIF